MIVTVQGTCCWRPPARPCRSSCQWRSPGHQSLQFSFREQQWKLSNSKALAIFQFESFCLAINSFWDKHMKEHSGILIILKQERDTGFWHGNNVPLLVREIEGRQRTLSAPPGSINCWSQTKIASQGFHCSAAVGFRMLAVSFLVTHPHGRPVSALDFLPGAGMCHSQRGQLYQLSAQTLGACPSLGTCLFASHRWFSGPTCTQRPFEKEPKWFPAFKGAERGELGWCAFTVVSQVEFPIWKIPFSFLLLCWDEFKIVKTIIHIPSLKIIKGLLWYIKISLCF